MLPKDGFFPKDGDSKFPRNVGKHQTERIRIPLDSNVHSHSVGAPNLTEVDNIV
jgi:hypothetical protein